MLKKCIVIATFMLYMPLSAALTFPIDMRSNIVGEVQYYIVKKGDSMQSIAEAFDLGILELKKANPSVKSDRPKVGTELTIPTSFILPSVPQEGMVLNVAELRVYYFPPGQNIVITHPVGIGQPGWMTPVGETTIVRKRVNPTWTPPPSIRREAAARGRTLPDVVPSGPWNPLGYYAMNLGWQNYLMHGTNAPHTVGLRSTHGCIRMYPADIENLFKNVSVGTKITIVHEPYKIGLKDEHLYLEVHEPFPEKYYNMQLEIPNDTIVEQKIYESLHPLFTEHDIDWAVTRRLIDYSYGYPVPITYIRHKVIENDDSLWSEVFAQ